MAETDRRLDLLLLGATALTGDPGRPVIGNCAIGIENDRLVCVESGSDAPPPARRTIRLDGRVVTPGLMNVHTHAVLTMVRGVAEDLGFAPAYTLGIPQGRDVSPEQAHAMARLGALEALLFGSTLINDTYVHADVTTPAMAELGLRVWSCGRIHDVDFAGVADGRWEHDPRIGDATLDAALELAERFHGRENGRIGVQLAAHAPDTCSAPFLRRIGDEARRRGLRVTTHLSQSKVEVARTRERDGMTPPELLDSVGLLNDRLIAAHCIHLTPDDIRRVGAARINVAHIPKGNATGGTMAPTGALRRAGANLALATDNMHADMVEVMRWALAVGRLQEGRVTDFWQPADVFAMATRHGALAMGSEEELGSLVPGKKADLVVFDFRRVHLTPALNPLGTLVHVGQGRDVEMVIVDGRVVVEDGRPLLADAEAVRREAAEAIDALWAQAR